MKVVNAVAFVAIPCALLAALASLVALTGFVPMVICRDTMMAAALLAAVVVIFGIGYVMLASDSALFGSPAEETGSSFS